jgi:predicted HicB family RNase H-like nuclease
MNTRKVTYTSRGEPLVQLNLRVPVRVAEELDEMAARMGASLNSAILVLFDRVLREDRLWHRADDATRQ